MKFEGLNPGTKIPNAIKKPQIIQVKKLAPTEPVKNEAPNCNRMNPKIKVTTEMMISF